MVVEGIAKGSSFSGALGSVVIACHLDDLPEFTISTCEARVCFLDVHGAHFDTEV